MSIFCLLIICGFAAAERPINPAEFPKTTKLITDLAGVAGQSSALHICVNKVDTPLDKTIHFGDQVVQISDKMKKIEQRTEVTIDIMNTVMLIPYVGQAASIVLHPAVAVLNTIKSGIAKVEPIVAGFANKLHTWTAPLQTVQHKIDWVTAKIGAFTNIVSTIDAKAMAAEGCANSLPVGRTKVIHALEGVSGKLDIIPHGFSHLLGEVNKGCQKVQGVLGKLHLLRRRRGLPSLSKVNHVLDAILSAFGPLGHFLDEVDHVLHKKFCLLKSLEELVKAGVKIGKEVAKGAEHIGKEVIKGAKHIVDEAGHVWVEVDKAAEHVIHEVGHGIEHAGKEIIKGAEHVVHEVGKGAEHVGHEVVKGVEHVGHEISKGVHHIGHVLHHIFGRRELEENLYLVDGNLYLLVNGSMNTRTRRGIDVCVSLSDILKGVNAITGGLIGKAEGLIDKLFHGKSPFHIPGLSTDVLHIGSLFHNLNFASILPSAKDLLKLPQLNMENILKLNVKLFDQMLPQCAATFAKVHFG
ncbi:uncharacterized protein LOC135480738 [Liolophura sinensis]|uniref:uncharacterized protein LOC135480738 n=1 Tax=Liolophura sinensis TaxID=3198878 RepID=UPI0031598395